MKSFLANNSAVIGLLLATTLSVKCTGDENQNLINFLMVELKSYPDWLIQNKLDPTPVIATEIDLSEELPNLYTISGNVRNHQIFGHSDIYSWDVVSTINSAYLEVKLDFLTYSTTGECEVDGSLIPQNASFTGSGLLNLTADALKVRFQKYAITPEGFVDLNAATRMSLYEGPTNIALEGLDAGGHEKTALTVISMTYKPTLNEWLPVDDYLTTFLQEIFDKTPFADIIGSS